VTALDSFRAKGPSGESHHFSMTEMTHEGNPNMYQYIESLNLNLAIDVPRSYLELIYDLAIQLSTALDFAHTAGLVHGQLDLSKVVLAKEGDNLIFKITDFAPVSSLEMPVSSEAAYWPFSKQKQELTHREKLEVLMLKDIYSLGICILEMMIGRFSKKRCSITLDSLPLTWSEFNESTPLIQVLVECIQIDSITQRKGKLAHIRKLLIREFKKFFQRTFYKMEKPFIGKKVDVLNKQGIVALFRGNQEEALHLWQLASELNDRHFDSKVNFCMHRWSTGVITDEQINAELMEFVYEVPGKGQLLQAALLIA
jgi:serine/threonine protein kinase